MIESSQISSVNPLVFIFHSHLNSHNHTQAVMEVLLLHFSLASLPLMHAPPYLHHLLEGVTCLLLPLPLLCPFQGS